MDRSRLSRYCCDAVPSCCCDARMRSSIRRARRVSTASPSARAAPGCDAALLAGELIDPPREIAQRIRHRTLLRRERPLQRLACACCACGVLRTPRPARRASPRRPRPALLIGERRARLLRVAQSALRAPSPSPVRAAASPRRAGRSRRAIRLRRSLPFAAACFIAFAASCSLRAASASAATASHVRAARAVAPPARSAARDRAGPGRPTTRSHPGARRLSALRRMRSSSCCCRAASCFSLSSVSSTCDAAALLLLLLSALNRSRTGSASCPSRARRCPRDPAPGSRRHPHRRHRRRRPSRPGCRGTRPRRAAAGPAPAVPPGARRAAFPSPASRFSALSISAAACGRIVAIFFHAESLAAIPRSTRRLASCSTSSRNFCCDRRSVARFSSSVFLSSVALSRAVLNDAAITCRCRSDSGPGLSCCPPPATTAAAALLLPVVLPVRTHLQEVDVRGRRLGSAHGVVVGGPRVVRDHVAGHEMLVLEHERVTRRKCRARSCPTPCTAAPTSRRPPFTEYTSSSFGDAVVVLGACLREHLVHREHLEVASRLDEAHRRRAIGKRVDRVVERSRDHPAVGSLQLHLVEALALDAHHRDQRAIGGARQLQRVAALHDHAAARRSGRVGVTRTRTIVPVSAAMSPVLSTRWIGQLRVGGIAVLEVEPLHERQVGDVETVHGRTHAARLDRILRDVREVEQAIVVASRAVSAHRHPRPRRRIRRAHQQVHAIGVEAAQRRRHELVAALGDRRVSRLHGDREHARPDSRRPTVRAAGRARAASTAGPSERDARVTAALTAAKMMRRALEVARVHGTAVVHAAHAIERGAQRAGRRATASARVRAPDAVHVHGRDHRAVERRFVLLDVERDLGVARRRRARGAR